MIQTIFTTEMMFAEFTDNREYDYEAFLRIASHMYILERTPATIVESIYIAIETINVKKKI